MKPWHEYPTVAETTDLKWTRCQDCDKYKKADKVRVTGNLSLCKKCFGKIGNSTLEENE